jgi:hypothetical protein
MRPLPGPRSELAAQVLLYFVPADGASFQIEATLSLSGTDPAGNPMNTPGHAVSVDQIITTRRGASSWLPMKGMRTTGSWTLDLFPPVLAFFQNEQIKDVLFVIGYNARVPDRPVWLSFRIEWSQAVRCLVACTVPSPHCYSQPQ